MRNYLPTSKDQKDLQLARKWIEAHLKKNQISIFYRVGSSARNTALKKNRQLDYFLQANEKSIQLLKKTKEIQLCHRTGGFPYFHLKKKICGKNFKFDLVPRGGAKTICQRTIKHQKFMEKVLTPALCEQIIKSKYYLKKVGLYDASQSTRGFSGWAVQTIILKYGSLQNVPKGTTVISCPVEPERNILGSLSPKNLRKFYEFQELGFKKKVSKILPKNLYFYFGEEPIPKEEWVRNYVKFKDRVILQIQDKVSSPVPEDVLLPQEYFRNERDVEILNTAKGYVKVHHFEKYIQKYGLIKVEANDHRNIREYNFFK